jgi:outer membrane protein assembly factor BamB
VDGKVVYTLSRMGDLFCFDAASGEIIWQKQLVDELGCKLPGWQIAGSPLVAGDLLVLNVGTAGLALNKKNGEVVWENGMDTCGYATPVPYTMDSQACFAIFGKQSVMGVAAKDGKKLWEFEWKTKYDVNAADPIVAGNQVFISSGYNRGCALIQLDGAEANEVWQSKVLRNQMNCSVLWKGHVYGFDEALLKCIDLQDGTEKWSERSLGKGSLIMSADGRMIIMSDKGELVTAKADPSGFTVLTRTQLLPRGKCWTTPALANGKIYARNAIGDAACVDVSKK